MPRPISCVLTFLVLCVSASISVSAAEPHVSVVLKSADEFKADIKYIVELTKVKKFAGQFKNVDALIDLFLPGVDTKEPIRFDQFLLGEKQPIRFSVPSTGTKQFKSFVGQNLVPNGIKVARGKKSAFNLVGAFVGEMRWDAKINYAVISDASVVAPKFVGKILDPKFNPQKDIKDYLKLGYDIGGFVNSDADGADDRAAGMAGLQKELLGALKKTAKETDAEFDLRKLLLEQQLKELERFFVEGQNFSAGWTTDVEGKRGVGGLQLTALPETDLDKSIQLLGQEPSLFAAVVRDESASLSARINHPIDEMRQKSIAAALDAIGPVAEARVDTWKKGSDSQREAAKKAIAETIAQLKKTLNETKIFDGLVDVWPEEGANHTVVGAVNSADGLAFEKVLELLPEIGEKVEFKKDVEKVGDVAVHSVNVPPIWLDGFQEFCGESDAVYFALTEKAVWYAAGPSALEKLKSSLEKFAGDAPDAERINVIDMYVKMGPWMKFLQKRQKRVFAELRSGEEKLKATEEQKLKEQEEVLELAIEVFADGDDTIDSQLYRVEEDVDGKAVHRAEGETVIGEGLLRFVGTMISRFSRETL